MTVSYSLPLHLRRSFYALFLTFGLFIITALPVLAASVTIQDQSNVLDDARIKQAASTLRFPLKLYTTSTFKGTTKAFQTTTARQITSKNQVVIAIDTRAKEISIASGKETKLTNSQLKTVADTLEDTYESRGDYTQAVLAAMEKLPQSSSSSSWSPTSIIIGVIIVAIIVFFMILRRRRSSAPVYQPTPSYNHYPPQQEGMNPLAAGALGAVAGGVAGYALGQATSEQQEDLVGASVSEDIDEEDETFDDFGGGSVGDFGDAGGGDEGDSDF